MDTYRRDGAAVPPFSRAKSLFALLNKFSEH